MDDLRDEFLSEEDLDLRSLTEAELYAWWDAWLLAAQATNDEDRYTYSHGVFTLEHLPAGRTVDLKPGTYHYYCTIPGHREAGMEGTLVVK